MVGRFSKHIREGLETDSVELKGFSPPLRAPELMETVIKETLAIANTGRQGYVLFGVNDSARRMQGKKAVPGIDDTHSDDQVEREINDKLGAFAEPRVRIRYASFEYDGDSKIGVLTVLRSDKRPHMVARNGSKTLKRGIYHVRRGTTTEVLTPDELREMEDEPFKRCITLLNFTHAFQDQQIEQLEQKLDCHIEHIWPDCKVDFDVSEPFQPQVERLVDSLGYTPEEWQDVGSFVISLPGFSEASAVLLAELHGRMGGFPAIVRRCKPTQSDLNDYVVAEVIDLSGVRGKARRHGAHLATLPDSVS
jgi:hypothetical protein